MTDYERMVVKRRKDIRDTDLLSRLKRAEEILNQILKEDGHKGLGRVEIGLTKDPKARIRVGVCRIRSRILIGEDALKRVAFTNLPSIKKELEVVNQIVDSVPNTPYELTTAIQILRQAQEHYQWREVPEGLQIESEEEWIAGLRHELGHIHHRHAVQLRFLVPLVGLLLFVGLSLARGKSLTAGQLVSWGVVSVAGIGSSMLWLAASSGNRRSRRCEAEADCFAAQTAEGARAAARDYKRVICCSIVDAIIKGATDEQIVDFLKRLRAENSTHPANQDRWAYFQGEYERLSASLNK